MRFCPVQCADGRRKALDFDLGKITGFSESRKDGNQIAEKRGWGVGGNSLFKEMEAPCVVEK